VAEIKALNRGGVYLAKLSPVKINEVGKIRPIIVLNTQSILNSLPLIIFVCPLSSKSQPEFCKLHLELSSRDNLKRTSYALTEHCKSISIGRIIYPRIAQVTAEELHNILHNLQILVGIG